MTVSRDSTGGREEAVAGGVGAVGVQAVDIDAEVEKAMSGLGLLAAGAKAVGCGFASLSGRLSEAGAEAQPARAMAATSVASESGATRGVRWRKELEGAFGVLCMRHCPVQQRWCSVRHPWLGSALGQLVPWPAQYRLGPCQQPPRARCGAQNTE